MSFDTFDPDDVDEVFVPPRGYDPNEFDGDWGKDSEDRDYDCSAAPDWERDF